MDNKSAKEYKKAMSVALQHVASQQQPLALSRGTPTHDSWNPWPERSAEWWKYEFLRPGPPDDPQGPRLRFCSLARSIEENKYVCNVLDTLWDEPQPPQAVTDYHTTYMQDWWKKVLTLRVENSFKQGMTQDGETLEEFNWTWKRQKELEYQAEQLIAMVYNVQAGRLKIHLNADRSKYFYEDSTVHPTFRDRFEAVLRVLEKSQGACLCMIYCSLSELREFHPQKYAKLTGKGYEEHIALMKSWPTVHTISLCPIKCLRKAEKKRKAEEKNMNEA